MRPTVLDLNLSAASANMKEVRRLVGSERRIYAVVKADAYGHGTVELARTFLQNGANALAVADVSEAKRLRAAGFRTEILVYPNTLPDMARIYGEHELTPVIADREFAWALSKSATSPINAFISLDMLGEGLGFPISNCLGEILEIAELENVNLIGLCAHPRGRQDAATVQSVVGAFDSIVADLSANGLRIQHRLLAASPYLINHPSTYLNAVDPGRILYGITYPTEKAPFDAKPVLHSLRTKIVWVSHNTPCTSNGDNPKIGVIPFGAADGFNYVNSGEVLVRGKRIGLRFKPSLEHTRLDLSALPEVVVGDDVVIVGMQGNEEITLEEISARQGCKPNQILTSIGPRVERRYRTL